MSSSDITIREVSISSPEGLLAAIPALLGFRPSLSLVILGLGYRTEVRMTLRYDLPDPAEHDLTEKIARHAASVLSAQAMETAVAVGYGPGQLVTPAIDAFRNRAAAHAIRIQECLRAEDYRYWSCLCQDPACCPPEGRSYNPDIGPADEAVITDRPVLASRDALAETLAPVTGEAAESMQAATRRAEERAARIARRGGKASARRRLVAAGLDAVAEAIGIYRDGGQFPSHDEPAWLSVVLKELRIRDDAWARMDPGHRRAHLRLWTGMTRLARPGYIAPAASLLAFTAWQDGNGALAKIALGRALEDDPQYRMAQLLHVAIDSGAPPSLARIPMSPEDVAASYGEEKPEDPGNGNGTGSTAEVTPG
ncbi:MAG: DUF4192 domain-containing protein [Nocardiopsaceae bacterium]|nr:DUF4192 domain-containing protein [Nocardiopsaceae bacterium]